MQEHYNYLSADCCPSKRYFKVQIQRKEVEEEGGMVQKLSLKSQFSRKLLYFLTVTLDLVIRRVPQGSPPAH